MTSNPTTPITIRRNNFLLNCDNDVTNSITSTSTSIGSVSKIPLPSPGSFRRSSSLRLRGSKSCLTSPTITTSLKSTSSQQFTETNGERINKTTILPKKEILQQNSSIFNIVKNTTPTTTSIKSSPLTTKLSSTITNNMPFRPIKITDDSIKTIINSSDNNTSFELTCTNNIQEEIQKQNNIFSVENNKNKEIEITAEQSNNQIQTKCLNVNDSCKRDGNPSSKNSMTTEKNNTSESLSLLTKTMENINNSNSNIENNSSLVSSSCLNNDIKISPGNVKRDPNGMCLNLNGPSTSTASNTVRTPKTPHTPKTPLSSSSSTTGVVARKTPKTPPVTPDSPHIYLDDDLDSLYSYSSATSGRSTMSCEHPYVARNGTTFSGRKMKYVVHCSAYAGQVGEDYLTPTQRAQKQLRRLKELLTQARQDLEQKDSEILRLTREVVELRLFKASLSSPEDRSNSSDAVTVREATTDLKTSQDVSPIVDMVDEATTSKSSPRHISHSHHGLNQVQFLEKMSSCEMQSSFADSGHFEDMTTSSVHSKDSYVHTQDRACGSDSDTLASIEEQRQELIRMYEKKIEELIKNQDSATSEIKRSHNDKVEALLQKLAECNSRYADLVPDYEQAKERIRELEKQLEDLQRKLQEQEETQKKLYLHMYTKEQEAEKLAQADQMLELAHPPPNRVSISELLKQLQSTQDELENIRASNYRSQSGSSQVLLTAKEAISLWVLGARKTIYRRLLEAQENKTKVDPEITLQFLKSAIYYFLTDKENSQGHLKAIESILEFSEQEKHNINRARSSK